MGIRLVNFPVAGFTLFLSVFPLNVYSSPLPVGLGTSFMGWVGYLFFIAILIAIIVSAYYFSRREYQDAEKHRARFLQQELKKKQQKFVDPILYEDPDFDPEAFLSRVKTAFLKVHEAWRKKDLALAEAFISDGIFERFNLGFSEPPIPENHRFWENIEVLDAVIVKNDSNFGMNTFHVCIRATGEPSENFRPSHDVMDMIDGKCREFAEFWSFQRKKGAKTLRNNGLIEGYCPSCGNLISMRQIAVCPYCNSYLRSGEFDWVLAEITQESEWWSANPTSWVPGSKAMLDRDPDFDTQQLEDRISVVFWRYLKALRINSPLPLRRISMSSFLTRFSEERGLNRSGQHQCLANCSVEAANTRAVLPAIIDDYDRAYLEVRGRGYECTLDAQGKIVQQNSNPRKFSKMFVLAREKSVKTVSTQNLTSNHCQKCGAPETEAGSVSCEYCGSFFDDGAQNWSLENIISPASQELMLTIKICTNRNLMSVSEQLKSKDRRMKQIKLWEASRSPRTTIMFSDAEDDEERIGDQVFGNFFGFMRSNFGKFYPMVLVSVILLVIVVFWKLGPIPLAIAAIIIYLKYFRG